MWRYKHLLRILVLTMVLSVWHLFVAGQHDTLKVSCNDEAITLHQIFKRLRNQYRVEVAYDVQVASAIRTDCSAQDIDIYTFLNDLLTPHGYSFELVGGVFIVLPVTELSRTAAGVQTHFALSGLVVDKQSGEHLPFASITWDKSKGVSSNLDGYFRIEEVPSDTSVLTVHYLGYRPLQFPLNPQLCLEDVLIEMEKSLAVLPLVYVESSNLRSISFTEGVSGLSLDADLVAETPNMGEKDILRCAQLQPGISATSESSYSLQIRGGRPDEVLVTYDGFTIYHIDHMFGVYSAFNNQSIKQMRSKKGWMEPKYGGRASGLFEISSKDGNKYKTEGGLSITPLSFSAYLSTPLFSPKLTLMFSFRRSITDVYQSGLYKDIFNDLYNGGVRNADASVNVFAQGEAPDYLFYDVSTKLTFKPNRKDILSATYYGGKDQMLLTVDGRNTDGIGELNKDDARWGNSGFGFKWSRNWQSRYYSNLSTSWSNYSSSQIAQDRYYDSGGVDTVFVNEESSISDLTLLLDNEYSFGQHNLGWGIQLKSRNLGYEIRETNGTFRIEESRATESVGYLQDHYKPTEKLELLGGVRLLYLSNLNGLKLEPRIQAGYFLTSDLQLNLAYARVNQSVRQLSRRDIFLNRPEKWILAGTAGTPVLTADHWIFSIRWNNGPWQFSVEPFVKFQKGIIQDFGPYVFAERSVSNLYIRGDGYSTGVDVLMQYQRSYHTAAMAYSLTDAKENYPELDLTSVHAPFAQLHEWKGMYQFKYKKTEVSAVFVYGSGAPYTPLLGVYDLSLVNQNTRAMPVYGSIHSGRLPAYHRLDISANYHFYASSWRGMVGLSLFNVYNRRNILDIQYYYSNSGELDKVVERVKYMHGFLPSLRLDITF